MKKSNCFFLFFLTGYRESGFAHAITAAGVAHAVARACAQGNVLECGCDAHHKIGTPGGGTSTRVNNNNGGQIGGGSNTGNNKSWKWGGCSHNLQFGLDFSKKFLDVRESTNGDIQSRVSLHNNEAGRLVSI